VDVTASLRGSALQLILRPHPFLFRPLELPARAAEYLAGIVRAQIDRLTPWSAEDAVFGWSSPSALDADRIKITIAATARAKIAPCLQALGELGAKSITVFTAAPNMGASGVANAAPIKVFEQQGRGALDVHRIQRVLAAVLLGAVVLAAGAAGAHIILAGNLDVRRDELAQKIAERRAAIRGGSELAFDGAAGAQRTLDRRKHTNPAAVLVLDALSKPPPPLICGPAFRIGADFLGVSGAPKHPPPLIRLTKHPPHSPRAIFSPPPARPPSDPGERFNIEAHIETVLLPR